MFEVRDENNNVILSDSDRLANVFDKIIISKDSRGDLSGETYNEIFAEKAVFFFSPNNVWKFQGYDGLDRWCSPYRFFFEIKDKTLYWSARYMQYTGERVNILQAQDIVIYYGTY